MKIDAYKKRLEKLESEVLEKNIAEDQIEKLFKVCTNAELMKVVSYKNNFKELKKYISELKEKYQGEFEDIIITDKEIFELKLLGSYSNSKLEKMIIENEETEILWTNFFNEVETKYNEKQGSSFYLNEK
ncbi:MAG: hypothetical protein HYS24_13000 [Ignavibacteriales bacterium]|nr:hypothetical protein [Ignavibacteriales bacterium]